MDQELKAMAAIQAALYKLKPAERQRVLSWINAKTEEGSWSDDNGKEKPAAAAPAPEPVSTAPQPDQAAVS